jgi:molybdate transport system substrate-binding protein
VRSASRRWFLARLGAVAAGAAAAGTACRTRSPARALIFAASSTEPPLREIADRSRRELGLELELAFGASSDLARQIRAGAPADLFLSADEAQLDALVRDGLCAAEAVRPLLGNTLVVLVPERSAKVIDGARALIGLRRIATGDPRGVPLGVYAKAWLTGAGVFDALAPALVPCVDARAAIAAVESDAVDAAIVYATDARRAKRARVALRVPEAEAPRITYGLARLRRASSAAAGRAFDALVAPSSLDSFRAYGFATR